MTRLLNGFGELQKALVGDTVKALVAAEVGMKAAATVVQHDAKERIGEYQDEVGPFPEWEQLADSTEEEKARLGFLADAPLERTGEMRDSIEKEFHPMEAVIGSKLPEAAFQEFGTEHIPPRPFLGPAVFANKKKIRALIGGAVVGALIGQSPVHAALGYDMEIKK